MDQLTRNYLLYSSVFAIFTEAFFFNYIIDWKLLYLIIVINYLILIKVKALKFNIYFLGLIAFFVVHGFICYTVISIPYNFMISQILGILVIGTFYYNFIPLYPLKEIVRVYARLSLYVAIVGYFLYFLYHDLWYYRFMSIFKEPAHYAVVVIPACYYYLKQKKYPEFLIIFASLIISNSTLAYIGCALMFIVPNLTLRRVGYFVLLVPLLVVAFNYVYRNYDFFAMRIDDTYKSLNVINTGKFDEHTNLSSYVMIANMFIAKENILDHPLGSGIGSHHWMHTQNYLYEMRPPEYLRAQDKHTDNSFDANSLATRLLSEFGVFGIAIILYLMSRAAKVCRMEDMHLAQGIFIYFLLKLFRDGHYFPPELFFFIWFFFYAMRQKLAKPTEIESQPVTSARL